MVVDQGGASEISAHVTLFVSKNTNSNPQQVVLHHSISIRIQSRDHLISPTMAPALSTLHPPILLPASGRVTASINYISRAIERHLGSLLRLPYCNQKLRAFAMYSLVKRQRTIYDPNAPMTEEQKEMEEGDRIAIITGIVSTSGAILVLIL